MTQLTYLIAIAETNAGTATVLQYVCPVGVLAYTCIKDRVGPTVSEIASMLLAIGGTFLIATHGQLNQLAITPKGLGWGLFSAFAYALYIILPLNLIKKWGSMPVIGVGMLLPGILMVPFSGLVSFQGHYSSDNLLVPLWLDRIRNYFCLYGLSQRNLNGWGSKREFISFY